MTKSMTNPHASGEDDLGLTCFVLECKVIHGENTVCEGYGSCKRIMVANTSNYMDCRKICLDRELCRHFTWYSKEKQCWVLDLTDEWEDTFIRRPYIDNSTITGSCLVGNRIQFQCFQWLNFDTATKPQTNQWTLLKLILFLVF